MKAIGINQFGGPENLTELTLPYPKPSRQEVRVKIKAIGFNPVDAKMRAGVYEGALPKVLGVDFSGVIDAVGEPGHEFSVGDKVYGIAPSGSYAESVCLSTQLIAKMPSNLSFEEAAAVPVVYLTAFQAMIGTGALQQNRPLFIAGGSGGVGTAAIALARAYRAGPIFTMAGSKQSRDYLIEQMQIPASQILDYAGLSVQEMAGKLIEMNGNNHFYFAMDFVGGKAKELCLLIAGVNGHVATILPEEKSFHVSTWGRKENIFWEKSLSLHFIFLFAALGADPKGWNFYRTQLSHLSALFEKGEIQPPKVKNVGLLSAETVQKAHRLLEDRHSMGKLVMSVSDSN